MTKRKKDKKKINKDLQNVIQKTKDCVTPNLNKYV